MAIGHDAEPDPSLGFLPPTYSKPVQNIRAAEAAAAELDNLQDEELLRQTRRVRELVIAANRQ